MKFELSITKSMGGPGVDRATAHSLVDAAHPLCPNSNATRGNVEVNLRVLD